ncbi:hypothetical protein PV327_008937 [Microctonus hyperodae]|uniref:C2H2-type domain-containing protein n=2 Tax=Microctonus hyperodae TaxID=165561 RepID=A0AA39FSR5_MICHY|nr:hypothetical protein PV327_008937 [Microctonus hyperodae]
MSQNNLLQGYSWENQLDDNQVLNRPIPDEVISIYEVYVKDETGAQIGRSELNVMPDNINDTVQLIEDDMLDMEIDTDIINVDGNMIKIFDKDMDIPPEPKNKVSEQNLIKPTNDMTVPYVQSIEATNSSSTNTTRLIDKDDPRSRLHFVKYLKRDGKTLKIWECGICSKEFRHQYTLMRHLPTHTDERNFKCDDCGKAFRQLSTLSQHKAIHSDARPYVCEYCKKTFNRVSTLISHRKTHSENKPHKCHLCGKGFHQKGNLRNHVFTHTNERPYKCELCNKGFNQMSNLVCHKVKAHAHVEKMQYSCGICGKDFPRRASLRSHEESKHGIKYRNTNGSQAKANTNNNQSAAKKNIKIIELTNDDDIDEDEDEDESEEINIQLNNDEISQSIGNILVDKIDTKAMETAIIQGQMPFALYKPAKGIPVLVKVTSAGSHQHMLTPANADDLRMTGKMSPSFDSNDCDSKAVQVKVPVVATVTQNIQADGKINFIIEPPSSDQEQVDNILTPLDSQFYNNESFGESEQQSLPSRGSSMEDCNELLELAAQGGIQFVRATEDGFEVMSNSEARDLMAQNSHDMTILRGAEADAINSMNIRNNINDNDVIVGDDDNQIMVLDGGGGGGSNGGGTGSNQKSMVTTMDGIEVLDDKDIRILDTKNFDERFVDSMTFFSQGKLDDLISYAGTKSMGFETALPIIPSDDDMMAPHQDYSSLLNLPHHHHHHHHLHHHHSSDISALSSVNSQSSSMMPLLTKNNNDSSSMSILNVSYLKNPRTFIDDFNILGGVDANCIDDINSVNVYDTKIKIPEFDDIVNEQNLLTFNQDVKLFNGRNQMNDTKLILPSFNDVKVLGPKYQEFEASSQYHDIKIFGGNDQYLRSTPVNGYRPGGDSTLIDSSVGHKDIKLLDKKMDTRFIDNNIQEDIYVKVQPQNIIISISDLWEESYIT